MIRFAENLNGNRVFIENANRGETYYCELCKSKMIPKIGEIKKHHFAHKYEGQLTELQERCREYEISNSMSEWHIECQSKFPVESREVFKKNSKGEIHRADICLEDKKTVIEFQHSFLHYSEFEKRNNFYNELGYKVVWLYDFDSIVGENIRYVHESMYDDFMISNIRKGNKVYNMDKETYMLLFGKWKPNHSHEIEVHFIKTQKNYVFYKQMKMVAGSFDNWHYYTLTLFVDDSIFKNKFKT